MDKKNKWMSLNRRIVISMKFIDNAMQILNAIACINSPDLIIFDLIIRIDFMTLHK